jgi:hypothetical protein
MKSLITKCGIAVLLLGGVAGVAQTTAKQDMKNAGQDVKRTLEGRPKTRAKGLPKPANMLPTR